MNISTKIRCPNCGGKGAPVKGGALKCKKCGGCYDDRPSEHGRAVHTDPERNAEILEREQAYQQRRKVKR